LRVIHGNRTEMLTARGFYYGWRRTELTIPIALTVPGEYRNDEKSDPACFGS